jgi:hypothetical protein
MAVQHSKTTPNERQAALRGGTCHHKVVLTLALAALTTVSSAQNDPGDHSRLAGQAAQSGSLSSAPSRPSTTHNPLTLPPQGARAIPGSATQTHTGAQSHSRPSPSQGSTPPALTHGNVDHVTQSGQYGSHTAFNDRSTTAHYPSPVTRTTRATTIEHPLSSSHRIRETSLAMPGSGMARAVRYGSAVTGIVERPIKSGYLSRTYVQGGHVTYARVYRQNTFQRFGHSFSYESLVPAVAFGAAYYTWAARPWSTPVNYRWRWEAEPWHAAFGGNFTPYTSYTSLDEWLTDYVIAQNLENAYETWQAESVSEGGPVGSAPPPTAVQNRSREGDSSNSQSPAAGQRPYWESADEGQRPYWEDSSTTNTSAQPKHSNTHHSAPDSKAGSQGARPAAEDSPPQLPGDLKAALNAQIKQQLVERQTQTTASDTAALPDSLRPGHTLFRVNAPLDVPSDSSGRFCSLRANDYIERTGDMNENGMVPVLVKLGGIADCGAGLITRVSVNDLEAMDSEQQQELTDALLAASKNMGGNGLPQAPATTPLLLAAGQARPAPDATRTLSQMQ